MESLDRSDFVDSSIDLLIHLLIHLFNDRLEAHEYSRQKVRS